MKIILRIARTELATLFYSPIAWFILILFSLLTASQFAASMAGTLTYHDLYGYDPLGDGSMTSFFLGTMGFFSKIVYNLYIYIPLLTMGLLSRETASGSIKLLFSSPVTSGQIVLGKYLAAVAFGLCMLLVPILSAVCGSMLIPHFDWPPVLTALLGLVLLMAAYCAVGLWMSSLTSYQVVAAIGTLAVLAALQFVGRIGQQYELVRELTYWLSINGRTTEMLDGQLRSDDVVYFLGVVTLFLTFTRFRLAFGRRTIGCAARAAAYAGLFAAVLAVGFVTSRPALIRTLDTTRGEQLSITENSRRVLQRIEGPVTVTNYVNLLDSKSSSYLPHRLMQNRALFAPYRRFKADLEERYVFYYDSVPRLATNRRFRDKTTHEMRDYMAMIYDLDPRLFLSPAEIRERIDLGEEQNAFVRVIELADGRTARLRDFEDMYTQPSEAEITAVFKKLLDTPPTVGFLTGHGERGATNPGDRGFSCFAVEKYSRAALVNQGFEIREISLAEGAAVPAEIDIVVIADPKQPFAAAELEAFDAYLARGGNLLVLTEPSGREAATPLLARCGLHMESDCLVQPFGDFEPDLILASATDEAAELGEAFRRDFPKGQLRVSMPGCAALTLLDDDQGFRRIPLLRTEESGAWIEREQPSFDGAPVVCNPAAGEREQRYITAWAAERELGDGRRQRILVTGDADCFANSELDGSREGYRSGNFRLVTEAFRYLTGGEFPIDVRHPDALDSRYGATAEAAGTIKFVFKGLLPALLLLIGILLWLKRRRH